ncbi:MAG: hypothetical protein MJ211_08175 [Bacteroidales bacterium]|nr:hypothetical protein [Bacteroidales bacterium]
MKFPKTRLIKIIITISLLLSAFTSNAQLNTKVYFSPRITLGWCFYTGFTYGVDLTFGLINLKTENPEINFCLSPQYYFVNYKNSQHSLISFNLVIESDYYKIMAGMGQASTKWGFKNINHNKAFGYHVGAGLSTDSKYTPWIEAKTFILHNGYWEFYSRPYYLSADMYFRPEPYIFYEKNDGQQ